MPKVQCKLGPIDLYVAGFQVSFAADKHGRFVCDVTDQRALACLLSVEHYEIAEDLDDAPDSSTTEAASAPAPAVEKPKRPRAAKGKIAAAPGLTLQPITTVTEEPDGLDQPDTASTTEAAPAPAVD